MTKTYNIEGMHCSACVAKITEALRPYAQDVSVTLNPPQAKLTGEKVGGLDALNQAVAVVGDYVLKPALVQPAESKKSWVKTYYPLLLIIGFIALVSLKDADNWMLNFMAGFFIVFAFFKLLDLRGFSEAYSTYDLLAKRWRNYGLIYPFLELGLGLAFLFQFQVEAALVFSIILMGFSSLGVLKAVLEKRAIRCACLGTALNLPMSTITLVEDLGMAAMAVLMLA